MKVIALLHGKTLVLIDHKERRLEYIPTYKYLNEIDDHYALAEYEIMSYLYENAANYSKIELFKFEE